MEICGRSVVHRDSKRLQNNELGEQSVYAQKSSQKRAVLKSSNYELIGHHARKKATGRPFDYSDFCHILLQRERDKRTSNFQQKNLVYKHPCKPVFRSNRHSYC